VLLSAVLEAAGADHDASGTFTPEGVNGARGRVEVAFLAADSARRIEEVTVSLRDLPPSTFLTLVVDDEHVAVFRKTRGGHADLRLVGDR
jgi:hypothetical protein